MKSRNTKPENKPARPGRGKVEIRKDLEDGSRGKDLSYLNEMPQMGGYEGVKAGVPPPKQNNEKEENMADES
jgi:hypothetical protein